MFKRLADLFIALTARLDTAGAWLAPMGLRLILAWEFWEAGMEKLHGENWFGHIQSNFPFPFNVIPSDISWAMATWSELALALALLVGLGTRFAAFALMILTTVAIAAVHWPADWMSLGELWMGYAITDKGFGNYKLPLLYLVMLLPLLLRGAGQLSIDALLVRSLAPQVMTRVPRREAWALALAATALPLLFVLPFAGTTVLIASSGLAVWARLQPAQA